MTVVEALSVYGRLRNEPDDLAWTWPWRRRRRSALRFQASRLLGKVAAAAPDAEVTIPAWSGSTIETAYRELMDELGREREVHGD
jgi:hypothetical protein